jgi:hypothetical protein
MNKLLMPLLLTIISLSSCMSSKTFSEINGMINYETVNQISITTHRADQQFTKLISDKDSIKTFVIDLNESEMDGPWKGANWDEILIVCSDKTIRLCTNGKVFGSGSSGQFFKLD